MSDLKFDQTQSLIVSTSCRGKLDDYANTIDSAVDAYELFLARLQSASSTQADKDVAYAAFANQATLIHDEINYILDAIKGDISSCDILQIIDDGDE